MERKRILATLQEDKCKPCVFAFQVNDHNRSQFAKWAAGQSGVHIVSDGSTCDEERQGAVGCINLAVEHFNVTEHLVVIAG